MKKIITGLISGFVSGFAVLASTTAFAQSNGQMAVPMGPDKQIYDVPPGSPQVHLAVTLVINKGTPARVPIDEVLIPKQ